MEIDQINADIFILRIWIDTPLDLEVEQISYLCGYLCFIIDRSRELEESMHKATTYLGQH